VPVLVLSFCASKLRFKLTALAISSAAGLIIALTEVTVHFAITARGVAENCSDCFGAVTNK